MIRIGVGLGDRNGIGPELVARLLADSSVFERAQIVVVGDPAVAEFGRRATGLSPAGEPRIVAQTKWTSEPIGSGKVSAAAGAEALDQLATLLDLATNGEIDGIVFAPLNKQAMRMGGLAKGDELDFMVEHLGFHGICGELNVLGNLWTSRVTSHVALRDVASLITPESLRDAIALAHSSLRAALGREPRIAVAGLNPHASDGGTYGDEEGRVIAPAIERAQREGIDAKGPFPPDTVFVSAMNGDYDAVVTMYHDQGQIAMKLLKFGSGVTVHGGLPVPVTTVGHGTAYDIVGKGIARADGLFEAFRICCEMAARPSHSAPSGAPLGVTPR